MIHTEQYGRVSLIRIDRPERRNALDEQHCIDLHRAVDAALADRARCLVLTGAGTAFCSGADLRGVYGEEFRAALYGMLGAICAAPIPVLAAVNGPAIGAGTQLAIAADLRVADATARFGVPTARLGLAVDPWTVRRLGLLAGGGPARAMLLGCDELTVDAAERAGLVDRRGTLDDALLWAEQIAGLAPLTLAYNKAALEDAFEAGRPSAGTERAFAACWDSEDFAEGRAASQQKRPPRFEGR
jgi:enoyl-CoA hydratase